MRLAGAAQTARPGRAGADRLRALACCGRRKHRQFFVQPGWTAV